ncbi:MAG: DJ-1/PfpI family protein [Chloroflexota bacterium]|nr:DJ-1/PfpI family protein [Chloroflexota bacterium]
MPLSVGILIFDDVEVLDCCGPFEVFATTVLPGDDASSGSRPFNVFTVAEESRLVRCRGGLMVQPHHTINDHPALDIVVVPGGWGTRREVNNPRLIEWIRSQAELRSLITSVCTGAFMLGAAGLLDGQEATTHWASIERLRATHPLAHVHDDVRFTDNGRVVTSAGISAGIDMSLHLVGRLLGPDVAAHTARNMEYEGYAG